METEIVQTLNVDSLQSIINGAKAKCFDHLADLGVNATVEQSEYRNEVYHTYLNIDRTIVFTHPFTHSYYVAHMFFSLK